MITKSTESSQIVKYNILHPKDGVFPEKLNESRVGVGNVGYSIGKNPQPVSVKFTGKAHLRLTT